MRSLWLVFVVCVLKCSAMTRNELDEFSEYLLQTSQLDLNVKSVMKPLEVIGTFICVLVYKEVQVSRTPNTYMTVILEAGGPDDDLFDEDEEISDHAWENSGKFEGDLILNDRQRRHIVENVEGLSRNGLTDTSKRWPNNELIYFIQREHFNSEQVRAIESGIDDLAQASCVKFRPYKKGDRDAVVIQGSRKGCFAQVGYQGGFQVLNLSGRHPAGRGCFRHGTVIHEMLHTLGFYHMQSSFDRDDYIDVIWDNILQPTRHNFRKYNSFAVSDFGVGYDYDSVLHYSRRAFSSNGKDTLVPKQRGASIGQRIGLSEKDTLKLNKMYCDTDTNNFEAEEIQKPKKKKKPKNQPFEGHGIGYQQGKTVVIKLPASENIQIPDVSSIDSDDYFSKFPQTVPWHDTELNPDAEEVAYPYQTPKFSTGHRMQEDIIEKPDDAIIIENIQIPDTMASIEEMNKEVAQWGFPSYSNPAEKRDSDKRGESLAEAYERLAKTVKQKVYPESQNYAFKINKDYSEYYNPSAYIGSSAHNGLNKKYGATNVPPHIQARKPVRITHGGYHGEEDGRALELPKAQEYGDNDSSFRTSHKNRKPYSASRHQNWNENQMRKGKHPAFKSELPLTENEWYKKDARRSNPANYDPYSYTDYVMMEHKSNDATRHPNSGEHEDSTESLKKMQAYISGEYYDEDTTESPISQAFAHAGEDVDENNTESPQKTQSYPLFGAPEPFKNSRYKPVYLNVEEMPQASSEEVLTSRENR